MPHYETPLGTSYDPLGVSGAWNRMSVDSYQGAHSAAAIRPHTAGEDYQVPHARVDVFMGLALLRHLGDRFTTSAATR